MNHEYYIVICMGLRINIDLCCRRNGAIEVCAMLVIMCGEP